MINVRQHIDHVIYIKFILYLTKWFPFQMKFHVAETTLVKMEEPVLEQWSIISVSVLRVLQEITAKVNKDRSHIRLKIRTKC